MLVMKDMSLKVRE